MAKGKPAAPKGKSSAKGGKPGGAPKGKSVGKAPKGYVVARGSGAARPQYFKVNT